MRASQSHAPADHFNPERTRLSDLNSTMVRLRGALPLLHRVAAGAHHGAISACAAVLAFMPAHALTLNRGRKPAAVLP